MTDRCMSCGKHWPIHRLDAKPQRLRGPNHTEEQILSAMLGPDQFEWLEGPCCYGPGYVEGGEIADTPTSANAQGTGGIAEQAGG